MHLYKVFISSVQKEFAKEREALFQHFRKDALLSGFFEPALFEKLPAHKLAPNEVYLDKVKQSDIFLVILGQEYGYEDENGKSPTEQEFDHARLHHIDCLAFIKGNNRLERNEKEKVFIRKVQDSLSYKRFETTEELINEVNSACVAFLKEKGLIQLTSFDESFHTTADISVLDPQKIDHFIGIARAKRGFPLPKGTEPEIVLGHLNMILGNKIANSALLAFARQPQQFFPTAITKCAHFHGLEVAKPIPDHKVFHGDVFEQVDQAVDFVLSKISVSVGTRDASNQAPIHYEIPRASVAEAIVNAVAHRDYTSKGSVQVMLFPNRLEVSNPGRLVPELSIAQLKSEHASYPTNPKLAECLYQVGYIERFGTGTGEIFRLSKEEGLYEPFIDLEEGFKVIIWRPSAQMSQIPDKYRTSTGQVSRQATGQAPLEITENEDLRSNDQITEYVGDHVTGQATGQVEEAIRRVLLVLFKEMKGSEIQDSLQLKHREYFRDNYLIPSIEAGYVSMTIPDKPNSPNQKYKLTRKGLTLKKKLERKP
ncbi:MAG: DUF4062 domain-containing protein [Bacteroidetes bacterium]|nr:DUF4062 domain-containing protein [Bacteroidota bacterium]